jgi:hypothetical protein
MNINDNFCRSGTTEETYNSNLHGDVGGNSGDMRAMILSGSDMNANQNSGMTNAIAESIGRTFDKISLEEQLEFDRRAYEIKPMF